MDKRQFLAAGIGMGAGYAAQSAFAQTKKGTDELGRGPEVPPPRKIATRKAKTTPLFLTPPGWPNCIAADPSNGFWVQQQRHDSGPETAWLLDRKGKVLHSVVTECVDCSGMAVGNGFVWSGANGASVHNPPDPPVEGVFQTDMNGKTVSHRQIPFGPRNNGGSCHGLAWENAEGGRLWIQANRLEALVRIESRHLGMRLHVPCRSMSTGCMALKWTLAVSSGRSMAPRIPRCRAMKAIRLG